MTKLPKSRMILSFALLVVLANPALSARADESVGQVLKKGITAPYKGLKWLGKKIKGSDAKESAATPTGDEIAPPPPAVWTGEELMPPPPGEETPPPPPAMTQKETNKFTIPQVQVPRGFVATPSAKVVQNFARTAHQDNIDACVNQVAQACDGHFTRKLVRALSRGSRDVVDGNTLTGALRSLGITKCGHYASQTQKTQMEAFLKQNRLILFGTSYTKPCSHAVISTPEQVVDMKVSANRAWLLGASGTVYYSGADFKLRQLSTRATTLRNGIQVSADGQTIAINGGVTTVPSSDTPGTEPAVGATRGELRFDEASANDLLQ